MYYNVMPKVTYQPLLTAVLLCGLVFLPSLTMAGMTPAEVKAFEGYKAKAEKGDPQGQYNLADCFRMGQGAEADRREAFRWYKKSADQGLADGQYVVGVFYIDGDGADKNPAEAALWFRKAAEQGHTGALSSLGDCYLDGIGVEKDAIEAYACFKLAALDYEKILRIKIRTLIEKMRPEERLRAWKRVTELQNQIDSRIADKKAGK
jgi:TPR repeat protein